MIGYLDIPSGLSGDMFLSCLVDAGWSVEELRGLVGRLGLGEEDVAIDAQPVMRGAMRATLVTVKTGPSHHHRHLQHIREIISKADLPGSVKDKAIATFTRLAEAEAAVHGTTVEKIHFHEVGALDAIVDITGVALGLEAMKIERLYASPPPLGGGWAKTDHGQIPLPAPATLQLLAAAGAPVRPAPGPGELVTPTGAALLATYATFSQPMMRLQRIATGAGQKQFDWPNIARLWLGEVIDDGPMVQVETNIDDMNPQLYGAVTDQLFAAGAVDVWLTPVQMKKGRPAVVLSALAPAAREPGLAEAILRQTTTLGVRVHPVHRHEARRELRPVETPYGAVQVKVKWIGEQIVGAVPEYEDCRRLAEEKNVPLRAVHEAAQAAAHQAFLVPRPTP